MQRFIDVPVNTGLMYPLPGNIPQADTRLLLRTFPWTRVDKQPEMHGPINHNI